MHLFLNKVWFYVTGDEWGVTLRGDKQDYIHAVFVNVCIFPIEYRVYISFCVLCAGLQAAESIHHSSESHGVHCQRFLEDGP